MITGGRLYLPYVFTKRRVAHPRYGTQQPGGLQDESIAIIRVFMKIFEGPCLELKVLLCPTSEDVMLQITGGVHPLTSLEYDELSHYEQAELQGERSGGAGLQVGSYGFKFLLFVFNGENPVSNLNKDNFVFREYLTTNQGPEEEEVRFINLKPHGWAYTAVVGIVPISKPLIQRLFWLKYRRGS